MKFFLFLILSINLISSNYDTLDILHYEVNLEITDFTNKTIRGNVELTIKSKVNFLSIVRLYLLKMNIEHIYVDDNEVSIYEYNDTIINIQLPDVKDIGDTFRVNIYYNGMPQSATEGWGGFIWTNNKCFNIGVSLYDIPHSFGRAWLPCTEDFRDKATFHFTIYTSWPLNHMAICNGTLKSVIDYCSGKRKCEWELLSPIPVYLASVAVGEYTAVNDTLFYEDYNIPIQIWVSPQDTQKARLTFKNLKEILKFFIDRFGEYRWEKVGYVAVPFDKGAMEHATNIAIPNAIINGSTSYEKLIAHELAHHWFGNLLTCSKAEEMWINEGWTTFTEFLYDENFKGKEEYLKNKRKMLYDVLRYSHIEESGLHPLNNVPQQYTYGITTYNKGALVVSNLRYFLKDSLFFSSIKKLLTAYSYGNINSFELANYLDSITQKNVSEFFDNWVYKPGFPHYFVDSFKIEKINLKYRCIVYTSEKLYGRSTISELGITEVTFFDSLWNQYNYEITLENGFSVDTILLDFNPIAIFTDFSEKYSDAKTIDYKIIKNTGNVSFNNVHFTGTVISLQDSALVRVVHHWVKPDDFKNPIPGLILSKKRYWTIEGIFDENFIMKGKFNYSKNISGTGLDDELITNSIDSLVLLYRKDASCDWQLIKFTRVGNAYNGFLIVDTLKKGDYALGIWNWNEWYSINENFYQQDIKIYPNPTSLEISVNFPFKKGDKIMIYDINGKEIFNKKIKNETDICKINTSNLHNGIYILKIICNEKIYTTKFTKYN